MAAPLPCDNPFWTFSLAVYGASGVEAECLALQDGLNIDVNVLLFCAWLGAAKRTVVNDAELAAIEAAVAPWQQTVVSSLRVTRRQLKSMPHMAHAEVTQLRTELAALELRAEQIEQALLYQWSERLSAADAGGADAIAANVSAYLRRHRGGAAPRLVAAAGRA